MDCYQEKLRKDIVKHAYPVKPGKRFVSYFIDMVIICVVSFLLSLGACAIAKNSSSYSKAQETLTTEIQYYNEYISNTHLVSFVDDEKTVRKDTDILVMENVSRAMLRTYDINQDYIKRNYSDFVLNESDTLASYGKADYQTDILSYFYTVYVPSIQNTTEHPATIIVYPAGGEKEYLRNLYKNNFDEGFFLYPTITETEDGFPTLGVDVAYSMFTYLTKSRSSENETRWDAGKEYYSKFYNTYEGMLGDAETLCIKDEPYYTEHYLVYEDARNKEGRMMNIASLISIMIASLIVILVPKIILKEGRTVGRLAMRLSLADSEGDKPRIAVLITSTILNLFSWLDILVVLYIFTPYNAAYDTMLTPFIGNIGLWVFLLVIFIIKAINGLVSFMNSESRTAYEMVFKTYLKDTTRENVEIEEKQN